jgi:hypothetical protein
MFGQRHRCAPDEEVIERTRIDQSQGPLQLTGDRTLSDRPNNGRKKTAKIANSFRCSPS